MCFGIVDRALKDEELLIKLSIPEDFWDYIQASWIKKEKKSLRKIRFFLQRDFSRKASRI